MGSWPFRWDDVLQYSEYYSGPPLTDVMVKEAEIKLGYTLPSSYVKLLRHTNGGIPRRRCFPKAGTSNGDKRSGADATGRVGGLVVTGGGGFADCLQRLHAAFGECGFFVGFAVHLGQAGVRLAARECAGRR